MMTDLKETIELMTSSDYKDRLKAEYWQVKIRSDKLYEMLNKMKNGKLSFKPTCSYELLYTQWLYMTQYSIVLKTRADLEGVDLGEQ